MTSKVRVRFAPSPTGDPHVGNIRTAIYDWLFARHHGGDFLVRIEDTDQNRQVEGSVQVILEALRWLGLDYDEGPDVQGEFGPYVQSGRLGLYQRIANQLVDEGHAYRCYCSPERLSQLRDEQTKRKENPGYDRKCRNLNEQERLEAVQSGITPVIRFKMPLDGTTTVNDLVREEVTFENKLADDFVMLKSDGFPTYHLAHAVDDHFMEITHVLRGEEWLSSIPRHLRLYEALGWEPPKFAHLPIILAPDRSKLSKRHGATTILEYRKMGFLPHTMLNFLTLVGWSLDDKTELFTREELVEHFDIDRIAKAGAVFNMDKLVWMNGHYIRQMSHDELADALQDFWKNYPPQEIPSLPTKEFTVRLAPLVQERLKTLCDAAPLLSFFFKDEIDFEADLIQKGMDASSTKESLNVAYQGLANLQSFEADSIEGLLRPMAKDMNVKAGQLFGSLRVATTGLKVAPPLFETIEVLGKERTLELIQKAVEKL